LGLDKEKIKDIHIALPYKFTDEKIDKTWIVIPCLAELRELPEISLDWEHIGYKWISPQEIKIFATVPRLDTSLKRVLEDTTLLL